MKQLRTKNALCHRSRRLFLRLLLALSLGWGISVAHGQTSPPTSPSSQPQRSGRSPVPAHPRKQYFECGGDITNIQDTLTQDWAGYRTELNKFGIVPTASYSTQLMGNPSGGQSRGFTYSGTLQAAICWDLDKLIGVPGLSFNIGGGWSTGKSLSSEYVGNVFAIQSAYTAPNNGTNNLTLGELYLQQQLFDNSLTIAVGRLSPQDSFASLPVFSQYLNAAINPIEGSLSINDPSFTAYAPGVEWGVQALYNLTPRFQIAAGVFNTNQNSAAGAKGGLDFSLQQGNRGALSVVQATYLLNQAADDAGLPGQFTFGGFYDSNRFASLNGAKPAESGTYSVYGIFQQMVYRDGGPASQKGLTVWGKITIAPKSSVNTIPYFVGAGLSYQGVISGRDNDIASAGVIYGSFSRYVPDTTAETVIEANYQITLKRWLTITPDLQYIIRPSGSSAISNALVLGAQVAISF